MCIGVWRNGCKQRFNDFKQTLKTRWIIIVDKYKIVTKKRL